MSFKKTGDDPETAMNELADSVLGLSDEAIVGEIGEAGADPDEEAERTRLMLRRISRSWGLDRPCEEDIEAMTSCRRTSSLKG